MSAGRSTTATAQPSRNSSGGFAIPPNVVFTRSVSEPWRTTSLPSTVAVAFTRNANGPGLAPAFTSSGMNPCMPPAGSVSLPLRSGPPSMLSSIGPA